MVNQRAMSEKKDAYEKQFLYSFVLLLTNIRRQLKFLSLLETINDYTLKILHTYVGKTYFFII